MSQPTKRYVERRVDQIRAAVETGDTVLAWETIQQVMADGYPDLAASFLNGLLRQGLSSINTQLNVGAHV